MKNNKAKENINVKGLYELIWSKPINQITKEIGVSYSELKKICRNHNIPTPKNGHWLKLKYGKSSAKIPLPPGDHKTKIFGKNDSILPNENSSSFKYHLIRKELLSDQSLSFEVPDRLVKPDPIIKNSKKIITGKLNIRQEKSKKRGATDIEYFVPEVTKELLPKALRILDTIFKVLRKRGHHLYFKGNRSVVVIDGMELSIRLREKNKRVSDETIGPYSFTKLVPNGILIFQVYRSLHDKSWSGSTTKPLEDKILTILTGLELFAKNEKEYQVRLERGWEEQRIRREKEERIKAEKDAELKKLKNLIDQSEQWHKVQKFRAYIDHLEKQNSKNYYQEQEELINWAREKADWMDPTRSNKYSIILSSLLNNYFTKV